MLRFLLYPLSLLPLPVLYGIAEVAVFALRDVVRYRGAVIADNLRHAFPEKPEKERREIQRRFYRAFAHQWIETLKLFSISRAALLRRMQGNWGLFGEVAATGRDACILLGHQFNWEWAAAACAYTAPQRFALAYLPPDSPAADALMRRLRTRAGTHVVSTKALRAGLRALGGQRHILALVADQNPGRPEGSVWISFFGREVPFFTGTEALARLGGKTVIFGAIRKEGRGRYRGVMHIAYPDAAAVPEGEIMRAYAQFLEEEIRRQPETWLWSHRRWKHAKQ